MTARFSIGIDLGTTNSALAYVPLAGDEPPGALAIPQWETADTLVEACADPARLERADYYRYTLEHKLPHQPF